MEYQENATVADVFRGLMYRPDPGITIGFNSELEIFAVLFKPKGWFKSYRLLNSMSTTEEKNYVLNKIESSYSKSGRMHNFKNVDMSIQDEIRMNAIYQLKYKIK